MRDNGGSAFPRPTVIGSGQPFQEGDDGMSLRQWFAGMALQGLLACPLPPSSNDPFVTIPKLAFKYADAMLKEAQKGGNDV